MYLTSPIHSKGFQSWKRLIKYANVKFSPGQKASKRSGVGIRCWLCTQQRRNWSVTPHQGVVRVQCQRSFLICALEHRVRNALLHLEQALRHGWMESDKHSAGRKTQLWPGLLCTHWEFSPCFACTEETKVYGCNSIPTLILQDFVTFPNLEWLCIGAFITNMIWYDIWNWNIFPFCWPLSQNSDLVKLTKYRDCVGNFLLAKIPFCVSAQQWRLEARMDRGWRLGVQMKHL